MAEIYRARTRTHADEPPRWVAIKMMRPSIGHEELREQLFKREARIASAIAHPNVIPLFEYGLEMERHYLAMEYVRGRDLSHLLKNEKKGRGLLPYEVCLYIGYQAAAGLGYAQRLTDERGLRMDIVHRDISPGNVMVGYDGQVKVLDFGVARMNETEGMRTQTGTLRGKFAYMSPEQTLGESLDARSDVFSLGTVLYELLTGSNCFRADNPIATLDRVQRVRPVPPSRGNRSVPQSIDRILARCLAKDRRRRFPDCAALEEALGELLDKEGFAGREALAAHMRERFSWEKSEEEKELLREEEEVSLLEVVDFALVGEDGGLDAAEVAVSEEEEASESEVKSARLKGTPDEGEVFDSEGKGENDWDLSSPGALTVAVSGRELRAQSSGASAARSFVPFASLEPDTSDLEKTVAQRRGPRFSDDEEIAGREVELSSILAEPEGARGEEGGGGAHSLPAAGSNGGQILVGRRAPEFRAESAAASAGATAEAAAEESFPSSDTRALAARRARLGRRSASPALTAMIIAALVVVVLLVASVVTIGIQSASKREGQIDALPVSKRTTIAPVTIMLEEHARRAARKASKSAPSPSAQDETPRPAPPSTPRDSEAPLATTSAAAPKTQATQSAGDEEPPPGDADDDPRSEIPGRHHGGKARRRAARFGGQGRSSSKAVPATATAKAGGSGAKKPTAPVPKAAPALTKGQASSAKPTGYLNVGAKPWAEISIDGRPWPYQTPQAGIELPIGRHTITLFNRETGVTRSQAVSIAQGAYKTISVDMTKK